MGVRAFAALPDTGRVARNLLLGIIHIVGVARPASFARTLANGGVDVGLASSRQSRGGRGALL